MSVSTVTISIEEFEDLIKCKRKLEKLKELKDNNMKDIRELNNLSKESIANADLEKVKKIVLIQQAKNLRYICGIIDILESKDE